MDDDHLHLAEVIKDVHDNLRKAYVHSFDNGEDYWEKHKNDKHSRQNYAKAMLKLATSVWDVSNKNNTRIDWCFNKWRWYFFEGGIERSTARQIRKNTIPIEQNITKPSLIQVLDVGSCYNPFKYCKDCVCLALDLTPATPDCFECDFLNVEVSNAYTSLTLETPITKLPGKYFHVVVFSLLLDYLPDYQQRWNCCNKAWTLLTMNGLLLIVTPDSKHQQRNNPMMKSWKSGLENMGFLSVAYEKQTHLHCMAFRKVCRKKDWSADANAAQSFYIPQDFKDYSERKTILSKEQTENEIEAAKEQFLELPFCDT